MAMIEDKQIKVRSLKRKSNLQELHDSGDKSHMHPRILRKDNNNGTGGGMGT